MLWLNVCVLQNSYAEILMPNVMVYGGGPLGGAQVEGGALPNGISAHIKETPESFQTPFHHVKTQREGQTMNQEEGLHQNKTLIVDFQPPEP